MEHMHFMINFILSGVKNLYE